MAKIPLRAYLKEIESLIERGEIEQAVSHAKNILRAYPKHIETYRLIGKAFLESQRYAEASDILERVLSVIPDDFVSQIGMSIIREDENNIDAAIWHMERAYEVQPFNPAVQDELRRLYGRRDGVEPPRIRLTRGALVRMYARGELYPQAIAETRAALAEDPQRLDLRVLLARLYYQAGQKNDAAEVCSDLITKLPYCYEANHLLAEILPTTARADETPKFLQRIYALDPYAAFISPSAPTSAQVPDQAVMVEQVAWEPSEEGAQTPDWTRTVGVDWEEKREEALPDWLNSLKADASAPIQPAQEPPTEKTSPAEPLPAQETLSQEETSPVGPEDLVPDWMKEAGWSTSERSADEITSSQEALTGEEELAPAEIPDWMQSIAPPEAAQSADEQERTDWLENILGEPQIGEGGTGEALSPSVTEPAQEESAEPPTDIPDLPGWLAELKTEAQPTDETEELPEAWAETPLEITTSTGLVEESGILPAEQVEGEIPNWLKTLESEEPQPSTMTEETPVAGIATAPETEQETSAGEAVPEWLASLEETQETPSAAAVSLEATPDSEPATPAEGIPEWLSALEETAPALEESTQEAAIEPEPVQPALEEALPEWLQTSREIELPPDEKIEAPEPSVETRELEDAGAVAQGEMPDLSDADSAMAWLEALAARQGADEGTLITAPEDRTTTPPEWVAKEMETQEVEQPVESSQPSAQMTEETQALEETPMQIVEPVGEAPVEPTLVDQPASGETIEPLAAQPVPTGETPSVEAPVEEEQVKAQGEIEAAAEKTQPVSVKPLAEKPVVADEVSTPDFSDMDAAMAWLEGLAARQGADEATLVTPPEQRLETPPDWVQKEMDAEAPATEAESVSEAGAEMDKKAEVEPPVAEAPAPASQSTETVESPLPGEVPAEQAIPEWLQDMDATVAAPEKVSEPEQVEPVAVTPEAEDIPLYESPVSETTEEIPSWLQGLESEQAVEASMEEELSGSTDPATIEPPSGETVPEWLAGLKDERLGTALPTEPEVGETTSREQAPAEPGEESPDWLAASSVEEGKPAQETEEITSWLAGLEEDTEPEVPDLQTTIPVDYQSAWEPENIPASESETRTGEPQTEAASTDLPDLQAALDRGDIDVALDGYNHHIQNEEHLDEIVHHLRDALYRYPVDIGLWQTLGDAYARNNQLQEALDAYTKAEELLR